MKQQSYDYFFVLDFEATCRAGSKIPKQEIIEFPVLKVDGKTFNVTSTFHEYIRPVHNPQLTDFCTKLTGITQDMVDSSDEFPKVFEKFLKWMEQVVEPEEKLLFVTCGDWDLKSMLPEQCKRENITLPPYCKTWLNIKKAYANATGVFVKGMLPMMKELNIPHVGRMHSGIDDATNIANILKYLGKKGHSLTPTSSTKGIAKDTVAPDLSLSKTKSLSFDGKSLGVVNNRPPVHVPSKWHQESSLTTPKAPTETPKAPTETPKAPTETPKAPTETPIVFDLNKTLDILQSNVNDNCFSARDREELIVLCISGKYAHKMEGVDRLLIEDRVKYFYDKLALTTDVLRENGSVDAGKNDGGSVPGIKGGTKDSPKSKSKKPKKKSKKLSMVGDFVMV